MFVHTFVELVSVIFHNTIQKVWRLAVLTFMCACNMDMQF